MRIWLIILAAGAITYLIRLSFIVALEHLKVPDWVTRGLRYVPPAVLSAIIIPELVQWNGAVNISWSNPQLLAGIVSGLVAWRSRNVVLTLVAGFACFLVLRVWM